MASLLGLGGISDKIREIIEKLRKPVEKAVAWIVEKAVQLAKKIGGALGIGGDKDDDDVEDERTPEQKQEDLDAAIVESEGLMAAPDATAETVREGLVGTEQMYHLESLELHQTEDGLYFVKGFVSPSEVTDSGPLSGRWPEKPPTVDIEQMEQKYGVGGSHESDVAGPARPHTMERHSPDIQLLHDPSKPGIKSIEGRLLVPNQRNVHLGMDGPDDHGKWHDQQNRSFQWITREAMHKAVQEHVNNNWSDIVNDLQSGTVYRAEFEANIGAVGIGFVNTRATMPGAKANPVPEWRLATAVKLTLGEVNPSGPAELLVITAFPTIV